MSTEDRIRQIVDFKIELGFKIDNANFKFYGSSLVNLRLFIQCIRWESRPDTGLVKSFESCRISTSGFLSFITAFWQGYFGMRAVLVSGM